MDLILQGLSYNELVCYLDDVCIFGTSFEEHLEHLDHVLARFMTHGLNLRLDKCVFAINLMTFLGFEVSAEGVRTKWQRSRHRRRWRIFVLTWAS